MFQRSSDRVEMVVEIYESADSVRGHDHDTVKEGGDTKKAPDTDPNTGGETACSRCYRVTAVCVVLLCVLLLTAVTVLWIKFTTLNTENNQLQTSYNNLTIERDQLQKERDGYLSTLDLCFKGKCFSFDYSFYCISNGSRNQEASRQDCRDKGADLVIINSKEEQEFISKILSSRKAWIGLNDREREDEWKWVDGTPLNTGFWGDGEPNGAAREDCVVTGANTDPVRSWADYNCNRQFIWICEKTDFI
ncbi:hypothetical protein AMELA_G00275380 [Ameiurus melas]|uniref:C-type lectin domain-containing protein n=1 Tax=Ameiurus melas TaxID=219545 RepID=A0A7J5ZMA4_AMEME|nr:hypothetical protein AMELA_G00275380 [Ameiurus melas]